MKTSHLLSAPVANTIATCSEGKIKYIGLSTVSSETVRRASKVAQVHAVQTDYSVVERAIEGPDGTDLLATCRELGIAVVAAMPLGRGLLTTTFSSNTPLAAEGRDVRYAMLPRFQEEAREQNRDFVRRFGTLADKKGCTVPQLAIAWLLNQGDDIIPIPGTKQIKYLEQNIAALDAQLTDAEEAEIRDLVAVADVAGGPVPDQLSGMLYGNTKPETAQGPE